MLKLKKYIIINMGKLPAAVSVLLFARKPAAPVTRMVVLSRNWRALPNSMARKLKRNER